MSDLVGNPEDRFSRVEAHFIEMILRTRELAVEAIRDNCLSLLTIKTFNHCFPDILME